MLQKMLAKNIFLICDSYPISNGEYFLDDEIDFLSEKIKTIYILTTSTRQINRRKTPNNVVELIHFNQSKISFTIYFLTSLIDLHLWKEFFSVNKFFGIKKSVQIFKIILADLVFAKHLKKTIDQYCKNHSIKISETIFYSYWHDKKALALALLKIKYPKMRAIARAHGWDVDYVRHTIPFLPFKNFIISQLEYSISISNFGAKLLESVSEKGAHSKIMVSKLGKKNTRKPLKIKTNNAKFLICSCSSLIALKRVDLIIDLISELKINFDIHWVHFGDGVLKREIENKAKKLDFSFELKGSVPNAEILDFYARNYIDLFINVSEFEGIPVSIMEAQSAGIPVLATNVGGNSEIVNNENGFLVGKDFDVSNVAELLTQYFSFSEEKILEKRMLSYLNWQENFSAEKNYKDFAELILNL